MDNKIIASIVIILLIVIGGFYVFSTQISANNNSTINNTNNTTQLNITHTNNVDSVKTTIKPTTPIKIVRQRLKYLPNKLNKCSRCRKRIMWE